jgi:hypothetical protein
MLDYLEPLEGRKFDCITFFAGEEEDTVKVSGQYYEEPGVYAEGSKIGDMYHILMFKDHKEDPEKFDCLDLWEAILVEPLEYISERIPEGWYGIIARKSSTSNKFIQESLDLIKEMV